MINKEQMEQICLQELKTHGGFEYIPPDYITEEMCSIAIEHCSYAEHVLPYIPEKLYTEKVCMQAIGKYVIAMKYIPEVCLNKKICEYAVELRGNNLSDVPLRFHSPEMWERAIDRNGTNLEYVPEDKRSAELCSRAFKHSKKAIRYIPEKFVTEEMCLEAAKANDNAKYGYEKVHLGDIPPKFRTAEVCFQIIKCEVREISLYNRDRYDVPRELVEEVNVKLKEYWENFDKKHQAEWDLKQEICRNPHRFKALTPEQRNDKILCYLAVGLDGMLLRFVPKEFRTFDNCVAAVCNDVDSLAYVPEEIKAAVIDKVKNSSCRLKILFGESDYKSLFL